jgi:SAM-dependent methyltransferase/uncharacterized protein YbaR (Trm112 family)
MTHPSLSPWILESLRCPSCSGTLDRFDDSFRCRNNECRTSHPVVNGIPVLIDEKASVFSIDDILQDRKTFFPTPSTGRLRSRLSKLIPTLSLNVRAEKNYESFAETLFAKCNAPRVLVLGGSTPGEGIRVLLTHAAIELVETDVVLGPRTMLICDAHNIPFADGTFDGVVVQAVLEHVVDPYRCVQEIHRVLQSNGLVYAETPFMQQVHGGKYDFTRFTHVGHRRLFRDFDELESGAVCGPGMALAWAYEYFLLSWFRNALARKIVRLFARVTAFYLKYFDYFLVDRPGAIDAASAYYFMGRKSSRPIEDRTLINTYRGLP